MRHTAKPSQFRRDIHVRILSPSGETLSPQEYSENISRYLAPSQESRGNKWLNHLQEKPLLELMNEQIQFSEFTPVKQTELNCYERLKNLLASQSNSANPAQTDSNAKLLKNVVIFETEINKLEQNYQSLEKGIRKAAGDTNKSIRGEGSRPESSKNSRAYLCSKASKNTSKHSTFDKNSFSYTLNSSLKEYIKASSQSRHSTKPEYPKHDQIKKSIKEEISELKKQSFSRFVHHQKEINDHTYVQLEQLLGGQLEKKIEQMVNRKILEYEQLKEQNGKFNTILLEKELHIENLLKEIKLKEEKLAYQMEKQEPHQQMVTLRLTVQHFYEEYHTIFGNLPLTELKKKLDYMETMCLNKYSTAEAKHIEQYRKLKAENAELQTKLKEKQKKFQERQSELKAIIKQRQKYQQLDNSSEKHQIFDKVPELKMKAEELDKLQRFILNKYVEWLDKKSQAEAKLIKLIATPNFLHDYQEMIQNILFFNQQLSPDRQTIYITKLLTGILKIKKIIAPDKLHEKLEPIKSLEEIETYIKSLKNRRNPNKKKTLKTRTDIVIENLDQF